MNMPEECRVLELRNIIAIELCILFIHTKHATKFKLSFEGESSPRTYEHKYTSHESCARGSSCYDVCVIHSVGQVHMRDIKV